MSKPVVKLPDSKGGWASLVLGIGLCFIGLAHCLMGDYEQAWLDWAGAFGTLGLPALVGKGYHLEIRRDHLIDTSAPVDLGGSTRLSESNEDIDSDPIPIPDRPKLKP